VFDSPSFLYSEPPTDGLEGFGCHLSLIDDSARFHDKPPIGHGEGHADVLFNQQYADSTSRCLSDQLGASVYVHRLQTFTRLVKNPEFPWVCSATGNREHFLFPTRERSRSLR
jgi:hypothetical protein